MGAREPWAERLEEGEEDLEMERDLEVEKEQEWEVGGLSVDGLDGGSVPVCKHLLACVLGEWWGGVLGRYVKEREVGREEMAGFGGE